MKRMDERELKSLYPPMGEDFSRRMDAMLRALPVQKEEKTVKRKLSAGLALALVLILMTAATALAAGLGVFGQLGEAHDPDSRLSDLETVSETVGFTVTADDGVAVTIDQAYYDGERVFISYRIRGSVVAAETGDGELENIDWFDFGENAEIALDPDSPLAPYLSALREKESGWARVTTACLHDGLFFQDGSYLDIIGGEERVLPDGTVLGWKECEVPPDKAADTLACKAVLFRSRTVYQKTPQGMKAAFERVSGDTDVPFTVHKETDAARLTGAFALEGVYAARADCTLNSVDLKADVTLECPEGWVRAWMDWDYRRDFDVIESWVLYSGNVRVDSEGNDRGVSGQGTTLAFEEIIRHGGLTADLRLVPVYADSGEHMDEAIQLHLEE